MSAEKPSQSWALIKLFLLTFVGLFVLTLVGAGVWQYVSGANGMAIQLAAIKPYLAIVRWSLIVAFVVAWKPIVERFMAHWPEGEREKLVKARWRITVWLVLIELVVIQGVLGSAINVLMQAVTGNGAGS